MSYTFNPFTSAMDRVVKPDADADVPRLSVSKNYSETISALELVTASSGTEVKVGSPDIFANSKIMGVALQAGITGFLGKVHILGVLEDASFNYPVNELLFLGVNGEITIVPPSLPTSQYSVTIGYSLGLGSVFIKIEEPILLT